MIGPKAKINPIGILDFGRYHPTNIQKTKIQPKEPDVAFYEAKKVFSKDLPLISKDHIFFQFALENSMWYGLVDRHRHTLTCTQGIENNLGVYPYAFPTDRKDDQHLVSLLSADFMLAIQESLSKTQVDPVHNEKFIKLSSFIDQALAASGQVLIISKLKKQQ